MTETKALTLAEFLLARIAEDERERFAGISPWLDRRWRAECEAKRRIVGRAEMILDSWDAMHGGDPSMAPYPDVNRRERWNAQETLDDLAQPYADHPDYREEWRA
jgi:Family of unknown function (DUF6221)